MRKQRKETGKNGMIAVAVIPARYSSTRFPGKPLAQIAGRPMIQHVYERASAAQLVDRVLVATDDERIAAAVSEFGGQAVMTSPAHTTGTDRIAEAITGVDADLIVNVQGDEPLLPSAVVDKLIEQMLRKKAPMGTVAVPFSTVDRDPADPNLVKVVVGANDTALYFSRAPIPYCRQGGVAVEPLLHWGIYAYTRTCLQRFVQLPRGRLEQCEMLEQLRFLENGGSMLVVRAEQAGVGVDTPEDAVRVERLVAREAGAKDH